jgi:regulator of sigma E protease
VYQTVRSMSKGSISVKEVSGPVGILTAGYLVAERGTTHLIWFLAIISANLAVMNFLPIPIVDGGLFTFLIIEKIKGSPISQRTQAIAQVVGLALLLSVFLFATYQDVFTRLPILFR